MTDKTSKMTTLHIKNMVCNRCIMAVDSVLKETGFTDFHVALGSVEVKEDELEAAKDPLKQKLEEIGFELIDDRKSQLIESIKNLIITKIHHEDLQGQTVNWSDIIADRFPYDYKYLSRLFSSVEGITIEQFIIQQKIEKIKELLIYDELTLSQIAWQLGYSSVAHVSSQFKAVTGMTPREFKQIGADKRKPIDKV